MSLVWCQRNGGLYIGGQCVAYGVSGHELGLNNPDKQDLSNVGPIPLGWWKIVGPPFDSDTHGPYVLRLEPGPGTNTFGRSGFLMHGLEKEHPLLSSNGCIAISPKKVREEVWEGRDLDLLVVAEVAEAEQTTPPMGTSIS